MSTPSTVARRLADPAPLSTAALSDLAIDAMNFGLYEPMVARLEQAVAAGVDDTRIHQLLGLGRAQLLDSVGAIDALQRAATLAPGDARIAHALARSTWESGSSAVAQFDKALKLAPSDAGLFVGYASALAADGRGEEAEATLVQLLSDNPGWHEGHKAFAQIAAATRSPRDGTMTVGNALTRYPDDPTLWQLRIRLLLDARRYQEVIETAQVARMRLGESQEWIRAEAMALSELGQAEEAQRQFDRLPPTLVANGLVHPIRNLIRLGRIDEALALAETPLAVPDDSVLWPYRALLWRLTGDARWEWLEGDERLVGVYDLGFSQAEIASLAQVLRAIHGASGELTDQSVRGGTQTDGNILARAEPEIVALRKALLDAVGAHIAQLPPPVAKHPTLIEKRAPVRIAGSWSVRLSDAGFHVDHVHPQGWLSSAFYVALPEIGGAQDKSGWLAFGENRALLPDLEGFRFVEPKPGRLALFPATMWHGTRPFAAGERMTVAFDIARP